MMRVQSNFRIMFLPIKRLFSTLLFSTLLLAGCPGAGADVGRSENADLVFGGAGTGPSEFTLVRDLAFDSQNNLYVLESNGQLRISKDGTVSGQARVQKFDDTGRFLLQFPLGNDLPTPIKGGGPTRIAVDSRGTVAVALPQQNVLRLFDGRGQRLRDVDFPGARAVTTTRTPSGERFAVVAGAASSVGLVDARSGAVSSLPLSDAVKSAIDIAATPDGSLWILGVNQIWGFDQNGRRVRVLGSGQRKRAEDGSEPQSSLASDSKGNLYAPAGGNSVLIARYSANGQSVAMRRGQFKFADSWGTGGMTPLAVDQNDRLWLVSTSYHNKQNAPRYHFSPAVIRTSAAFFQEGTSGVKTLDARVPGLSASIQTGAPYNIFNDLSPAKCEFVVAPSNRNIQQLRVRWNVFDWRQNSVGQGEFDLALQDGRETRAPMTWTPPAFGWYSARAQVFAGNDALTSVVAHFGVTPRYANMVSLQAGESRGGWEDAPRQLFSGLPMMRVQASGRTDAATLDKWMANFQKTRAFEAQGLNIVVQLAENKAQFNADHLRPILQRLRGQVRYVELFNEPNFTYKAADFVAAARPVYNMIKQVDPNFQVLGPAVCGISLPYHDAFWKAGGGEVYDEFSTHDYEGGEAIMPEHWRTKFAQLRALMKRYGVDDRPIWQSERAIGAVRSGSFLPLTQAVRVSLHRDVLQTLGVPPQRNLHYYLNKGGYSKVPSYLWTAEGPFPGALVLRTRTALTQNMNFAGEMNFGATGNQLFLGLRFAGAGGNSVWSLRNLGDLDQEVEFRVSGSPRLQVSDSWGNQSTVAAQNGRIALSLGQLPTFVRLAPGQKLEAVPLDLGRNMAPDAGLQFVGATAKKPLATLTNGVIEAGHLDSPTARATWSSDTPLQSGQPQFIEMRWPSPRAVSAVLLRGPRADNLSSALLDFDVQAFGNGAWRTVLRSRTPLPTSYEGHMADSNSVQWLQDDNLRLARFAPVTTDRVRIVALRATYGYNADEAGQALNRATRGTPPNSFFTLKEIEVFGP